MQEISRKGKIKKTVNRVIICSNLQGINIFKSIKYPKYYLERQVKR